jgi:hypothetical protein
MGYRYFQSLSSSAIPSADRIIAAPEFVRSLEGPQCRSRAVLLAQESPLVDGPQTHTHRKRLMHRTTGQNLGLLLVRHRGWGLFGCLAIEWPGRESQQKYDRFCRSHRLVNSFCLHIPPTLKPESFRIQLIVLYLFSTQYASHFCNRHKDKPDIDLSKP